MTAEYVVYMGLVLSAFVLIISVLILTIFSGDLKKRINFFFFLTALLGFMGMLSDLIVEWMIGQTSPVIDIAIRVLDGFSYSTSGLQLITFAFYLYEYLSTKTTVPKKPFYFMVAIGIANVILALLASFTQLYVKFDAYNNYIRQETFWVSELLPTLALILLTGITIHYIRLLKMREWVSMLLYSILPIVCYMLEILLPNIYLAAIGFSFTLFLIYVNLQVELKAKLKTQEVELLETRIAVMLSQIQPHFLYNTLNTIDDLIYQDEEKAHMAMYTFSDYLRGNMDSLAQKELIPFSKELEHTKEYLWLEKLRFEEKLQVVYEIQTETFKLPILTLQPIVENAVRYGITKKHAGGTLAIRTEENEDCYRIVIEDNGVGFDVTQPPKQDNRSHTGISNVRSRLEIMCNGTLTIRSTPGSGTTVTIKIPKRPEVSQ